jgi:hypothetical protein
MEDSAILFGGESLAGDGRGALLTFACKDFRLSFRLIDLCFLSAAAGQAQPFNLPINRTPCLNALGV